MPYTHRIATVELSLLGPDEIRQRSVVEVKTKTIYDKNLPKDHGLNDHRMGTVDRRYRCGTCGHNIKDCGGHFGHIELGSAIYHIGYIDVVRKVLSSVCFACSKLLTEKPDTTDVEDSPDGDVDGDDGADGDDVTEATDTKGDSDSETEDGPDGDADDTDMESDSEMDTDSVVGDQDDDEDMDTDSTILDPDSSKESGSVKVKGRLSRVYDKAKKVKQCPHCQHPMPRYLKKDLSIEAVWKAKDWDMLAKDPEDPSKYKYWESEAEMQWATRPFTSHTAYNILRNISDRTVLKLGFRVRPEHMILTVLPVPPPAMRPTITATEGSRERGQNDLTSMLQEIVKNAIKVKTQMVILRNLKKTDKVDSSTDSTEVDAEPKTSKSKNKGKGKGKAKDKQDMSTPNYSIAELLSQTQSELQEKNDGDDELLLDDDSTWIMDYSQLRYPEFARDWDLIRKIPGSSVMDLEYIPDFKPLLKAIYELQMSVTAYFNNDVKGVRPSLQRSGMVKKSLTRRIKSKEGRIRGNLMGKRVDFSARSVISPDPNIDLDEVGTPEVIALGLTYPERVNQLNYQALTQRVEIGWNKINGASHIQTEDGREIQLRFFGPKKPAPRLELGWIVHRYLQDGDRVIFNRQPSLHKESMMGHRVRVMKGVRTFRMNDMVTPPYNADFDVSYTGLFLV